jgi:hypothetical protein
MKRRRRNKIIERLEDALAFAREMPRAPSSRRTWFRPVRGRGCGPTASSRSPGGRSWCPAAEATIGAGDDVLAPDHSGEVEDAVGDDLRVLDDVGWPG